MRDLGDALSRLGLGRLLGDLDARVAQLAVEQERLARLVDAKTLVGAPIEPVDTHRTVLRLAVDLAEARYGLLGIPRLRSPATGEPGITLYESRDGGPVTSRRAARAGHAALGALLRADPDSDAVDDPDPQSAILTVRLRAGGHTLGCLSLGEPAAHSRFTRDDVLITRAFAATAAVAVQRVHLGEVAGHRARRLAAEAEFGLDLAARVDPATLLELVAGRARELTAARGAWIGRSDGASGQHRTDLTVLTTAGRTGRAVRGRRLRLPGFRGARTLPVDGSGRALLLPVPAAGPAVGVLAVIAPGEHRLADSGARAALDTLAAQAAVALSLPR
ncbi:GAF domain-containing protein [Nocardia jiangsuensis]|uniref:GAF domain-containing protein n=1 Tax=Nocardia jiangsuensis TaxID=1691563 RepID=A0ABV8DPJ4_9NOCA